MMGVPAGWITSPEIGLSWAEQLKACGNGVVPQQAFAAITDAVRAFISGQETGRHMTVQNAFML